MKVYAGGSGCLLIHSDIFVHHPTLSKRLAFQGNPTSKGKKRRG
jgi:hypothetical protein